MLFPYTHITCEGPVAVKSMAVVLLQTQIGATLLALQFSTGYFNYMEKREGSDV